MGNKNFLLVAFVLAALVGCDQGNEKKDVSAVQDSKTASATAIYLPSGTGLDFGRFPVRDVLGEDDRSKIRDVFYDFTETPEEVDSALAAVLASDGFSRRVNEPGRFNLNVTYRKGGKAESSYLVSARYTEFVREGFSKGTKLRLTWRYDFKKISPLLK